MDAYTYTEEFREWFWSQVEKTPDSCWLWAGEYSDECRGVVIDPANGMPVGASKMAYVLTFGAFPRGERDKPEQWLWVLHKCDLPICCNPGHLYLGTPKQNAVDRVQKGRTKVFVNEMGIQSPYFKNVSDPTAWVRECIEQALLSSRATRKKALDNHTEQ